LPMPIRVPAIKIGSLVGVSLTSSLITTRVK
jgi:hypothetical protein